MGGLRSCLFKVRLPKSSCLVVAIFSSPFRVGLCMYVCMYPTAAAHSLLFVLS